MNYLAYLQKETRSERIRNTWVGIALFVNADLPDPEVVRVLAETLLRCTQDRLHFGVETWQQFIDGRDPEDPKPISAELYDLTYGIRELAPPDLRPNEQFDDSWVEEEKWNKKLESAASRHQDKLRKCLTWLDAPERNPELQREVLRFLREEKNGVLWVLGGAFSNFNERSKDWFPLYYLRQAEYKTIMSPIVEFICARIERFQDETDRSDHARKEFLPIEICHRPGCGKFTVMERVGRKKFCSERCRVKMYRRSPKEWAKYMRRYRKLKKERAERRIKSSQGKIR